jgi:hypothetical protein
VAIFDQAATYTVTISGTGSRTALTLLNTAGTVTFAGTTVLAIGGLTLTATAVWNRTAAIQFTVAGVHTINTSNVSILAFQINFNAAGAVWTLASNFVTGGSTTVNVLNGALDLNGYTLAAYFASLYAYDAELSPTTTELIMDSGTLQVVEGAVVNLLDWPSTVVPVITGPGTIELIGNTPDNLYVGLFPSGAPNPADTRVVALPTVRHTGLITLVVPGNNTFDSLESLSSAGGVTFAAGTTNTFGTFYVTGAAGTPKTLTAIDDGYTEATQATLVKGSPWLVGANSVDAGNNTGLTFASGGGIDYLIISNINTTDAPIPVEGWVLINDSQTANWQNASNAQTPNWQNIIDAQSPGWTPTNQ